MPYSDRIYRLAYRLMGNREESEDIVQEVYLKLWGLRSQLDQYDSIEALSIRIARNLCLDNLRRRKTNQNAMNSEKTKREDFHSETPVDSLEKKEDKQLVLSLIAALPEPQRSLVHLRHIEEKDYEEIASMVNMNVNAIRVSISRARKQMREMLEKNYATWKA
ncbi:MAG: RNA polymerase sigma factor [Bacteroidales bacterium]